MSISPGTDTENHPQGVPLERTKQPAMATSLLCMLALPVNNTKPSKKMPNPFSALAVTEESNKNK